MKRHLNSKIREIIYLTKFFLLCLAHSFRLNEIKQLHRADLLLFCTDADRGFLWKGKRYSPLLDTLNDLFMNEGLTSLTIAGGFSQSYGDGAHGCVRSISGMTSRSILLRKLTGLILGARGRSMDPLVDCWLKVILAVRPSKIIGIQPPRELCIAAKQLGIECSDLQHGVICGADVYYGAQFRSKHSEPGWPDTLLCWDEVSGEAARIESQGAISPKVIGNPWFLRFIHLDANDELVNTDCSLKLIGETSPILVTLTWGLESFGEYPKIGIPQPLIDFIKSNSKKYNWWIRLHPVQLLNEGFELVKKEFSGVDNVHWVECSLSPLPMVLRNSRLHLTMASSTAVEASWFGIKSALLFDQHDLLFQYLKQQIEDGTAEIVAPELNAISNWIELNYKLSTNEISRSKLPSRANLTQFISEVKFAGTNVNFSEAKV